ncbi:hypothetical protein [Legionella feeleii]|uniref:Uncharacterized protein n=1 Tax=Legionella feeleii TaxID=453 RepID=A0A0W0UBV9_9GAMM|nr:hypothetical protein [Legionella feeleii]KTD05174.1 hypothetical protein Lfee_0010 [Legionella feeleii]SPX61052.1 Uncharacterised protein [Legionella feeleii]
MKERKEQEELLMKQLLDDSNIPALSLGWYQAEKTTSHIMAYGQAEHINTEPC